MGSAIKLSRVKMIQDNKVIYKAECITARLCAHEEWFGRHGELDEDVKRVPRTMLLSSRG